MTHEEIKKLPRAEYFDGFLCPKCEEPLIAYNCRMKSIEEHERILSEDLIGSDYLLLHKTGWQACPNAFSVAGVADQQTSEIIDQNEFVLLG